MNDEKWMNILWKLVVSLGIPTYIFFFLLFLGVSGLPLFFSTLVVYLVGTPLCCARFNYLEKKYEREYLRDLQTANYLMSAFLEVNKKDRKITKDTPLFIIEIEDIERRYSIDLKKYAYVLNKFLYMVNVNYYEKIIANVHLTREEVVKNLLSQVVLYLQQRKKEVLDVDDFAFIIEGCFFIEEKDKKAIMREFREAKNVLNGNIFYSIIRNDENIEITLAKEFEVNSKREAIERFDIRSLDDIEVICDIVRDDKYIKQYGNPESLMIDYEMLKGILGLMVEIDRREFEKCVEDYCNFYLASSYISNLFVYALVNNCFNVGIEEMVKVFKNWEFLSFELKIKILDQIFETYDLDYDVHPFYDNKKKNTKKVITLKFDN